MSGWVEALRRGQPQLGLGLEGPGTCSGLSAFRVRKQVRRKEPMALQILRLGLKRVVGSRFQAGRASRLNVGRFRFLFALARVPMVRAPRSRACESI